MKKRLLSILLVLCVLSTMVVTAYADETVNVVSGIKKVSASTNSTSKYNSNWQYWSQGASGYSAMRSSGCRVVAYAKLLAEIGYKQYGNPDGLFEWGIKNGFFKSTTNILEQGNAGVLPTKYVSKMGGGTLKLEGKVTLSKDHTKDAATAMDYLKKGYYVIMCSSAHFAYVGREASLNKGTAVLLDSWSSWSQNPAQCQTYRNYTHVTFTNLRYYSYSGTPIQQHTHNSNYGKGYCDACGTWLPNQNNNANVTTGLYEFTVESGANQLMDHPYQIAETYGTCYKVFHLGDVVNVVGAVVNGGGNTWYKVSYNGITGYAYSGRMAPHNHNSNYGKGYCDACGTWLPNQDNNASVETGLYEVVEDNPEGNIFVDHPYSIAEKFGTLYGIPEKGDLVEVIGAVVNGGGNTWYKVRWNGNEGYMYNIRLTPWTEPATPEPEPEPVHIHDLTYVPAEDATCTQAGHEEYWECGDCGLIFSDEDGEYETTFSSLRIPPLGHDFEEGYCTRCDAEDPDYTEPEPEPEPDPGRNNPFVDVYDSDYYCEPVLWAYYAEPQITDGMDDTHFGPNQTVTRGQAVTFLWRSMGKPAPKSSYCPFTDVSTSDYYYQPVLWALERGITNGTSANTFSPNATLTRGHIVTFLWRTTGRPDETGAGQWYDDAVNWAESEGLLYGTGSAFSPTASCPRSDVVTYLYRADQEGDLNPAEPDYDFVLDNCTWTQAFQRARDAGGQLVRIESESEYDTIRDEIAQRGLEYVMFRVGARRDENSADFYWVDGNNKFTGRPLNSTLGNIGAQWAAGEPSLEWNGLQEDVLEFEFSGGMWVWNDIADQPNLAPGYCYGYIIEY